MRTIRIKSRGQRLADYNEKYPVRELDATERVKNYFNEHHLDLEKACAKASKKALDIIDRREYRSMFICLREYPMETARPRVWNGHAFSPNAAANKEYFDRVFKKLLKDFALITTPTEIIFNVYNEMPTTVPPDEVILYEAKLLAPVGKPDVDNISKSYLDMMTDVLLTDDDTVYHMEIYKWYSLEPRVEIRITYESKIESDYLYHKLKNRKSFKDGLKSGQIVLERL